MFVMVMLAQNSNPADHFRERISDRAHTRSCRFASFPLNEIRFARTFSRLNPPAYYLPSRGPGGSIYEIRLFQEQDRENLAGIVVSGWRRFSINHRRTGAVSSRSRAILSALSGSR